MQNHRNLASGVSKTDNPRRLGSAGALAGQAEKMISPIHSANRNSGSTKRRCMTKITQTTQSEWFATAASPEAAR